MTIYLSDLNELTIIENNFFNEQNPILNKITLEDANINISKRKSNLDEVLILISSGFKTGMVTSLMSQIYSKLLNKKITVYRCPVNIRLVSEDILIVGSLLSNPKYNFNNLSDDEIAEMVISGELKLEWWIFEVKQ
jgi:hypothetical protein